jgi:hypothetical protein
LLRRRRRLAESRPEVGRGPGPAPSPENDTRARSQHGVFSAPWLGRGRRVGLDVRTAPSAGAATLVWCGGSRTGSVRSCLTPSLVGGGPDDGAGEKQQPGTGSGTSTFRFPRPSCVTGQRQAVAIKRTRRDPGLQASSPVGVRPGDSSE